MKKFISNIKKFVIDHKKSIRGALIMIVGIVAISIITFSILMACDIVYFADGMKFNVELFDRLKSTWWGGVIFVLLQTVLTMLLCVIPGVSMAFILLSQVIFPNPLHAFTLSFLSVMISSCVMYILGRSGGYKLSVKLLGEKDCEQALKLLRNKGTVFFPLMMMFPIFPDDALVMIAGTMKMSIKWFIPSIIFGRGIGIATIIFGFSIVPFDKFTLWWHWALFILGCLIGLVVIFYFANKLNKYMERRSAKNEEVAE